MRKIFVITLALAVVMAFGSSLALAGDKVTICHASGQSGTLKYETLNISENAVYGRQGNAGHFNEGGTPRAGHENDYFGACQVSEESSTPTPTEESTPSQEPTPTEEPTSTPESTPEETPVVTPEETPADTPTPSPTVFVPDTAMTAAENVGLVSIAVLGILFSILITARLRRRA